MFQTKIVEFLKNSIYWSSIWPWHR